MSSARRMVDREARAGKLVRARSVTEELCISMPPGDRQRPRPERLGLVGVAGAAGLRIGSCAMVAIV